MCNESLALGEEQICLSCQVDLPLTNYHLRKEHNLSQRFWGKVQLDQCFAYLNYQKGGSAQHLLYKIKYKNKKDAARTIGRWYGNELQEAGMQFDLIVPVPLHKKKLRMRGYNQSEYFAMGLSESLKIRTDNLLERIEQKSSQTNKNRFLRWQNVEGIYKLKEGAEIGNLHILLVDDVITTGATIEVCAKELLLGKAGKVSIAAIACAQ